MTTTVEETGQGRFITYLFGRDAGERAELRRCLAADRPSDHLPAYRLIERHASAANTSWERECYYLIAGLFALVERRPPKKRGSSSDEPDAEPNGKSLSLAQAVRAYEGKSEKGEQNMSSVERRFLALLDSDRDQLPYRLRQMLQMITRGQNAISAPIDWTRLLRDLQNWRENDRDWVRQKWAREFYQPSDTNNNETNEEN